MYVIGHSARVCETSVGVPCRLFPRWCDDDDDDDDDGGVVRRCGDAGDAGVFFLYYAMYLGFF